MAQSRGGGVAAGGVGLWVPPTSFGDAIPGPEGQQQDSQAGACLAAVGGFVYQC